MEFIGLTTDIASQTGPDGSPAEQQPAERARRHRRLWLTSGVFLALALVAALVAALWDWNWFRGPLAGIASARLHRQVVITGDLRVHPFSWQPGATVQGVQIANPDWAPATVRSAGHLARIDRIAVKIRLLPLLKGDVDLPLLEFDRPVMNLYRDAQGRSTWDFSDGRDKSPTRLPPIRDFIINDGKISYLDVKRNLNFSGVINATEELGGVNRGFQLAGRGTLNRQPFLLKVTGGALINIDKNRPYAFTGLVHAGDTFISAEGAIPRPFDFGRFYMNTKARGADLGDLYNLINVPLPNTPPYDLRGRISREGLVWKVDGLGGRVGSSDLAGNIAVTTGGERPVLTARLKSNSLDFPDLGALFGGARKTGKVASPKQVAVARAMQAQATFFPTATLNFEKIRNLDADVTYRAASIREAPINLRSGSVRVKVKAGLLRADPLEFDLPQGHIAGFIQLDGRKTDAVTDLDLRLANARLEHLIPVKFQGASPVAGPLVGRARLHGVGDSIHDALGDANGQVAIVAPTGEIRRTLAELAGVNVIKGLGLLFAKDQSTTPIRCGVAHLDVRGGVASVDRLMVDTGPVLIDGGGVINLDKETLSLTAKGHPKKFQLVRLNVPVTVSGSFLKPQLGIKKGAAIAQGVSAVALTALSPLAAILPFVDSGLAKEANCSAILADSQAAGAPVRKVAAPARIASARR